LQAEETLATSDSFLYWRLDF